VESLAKKYEEKYKQVAELASKLAVEEAAFRDVQVFAFLISSYIFFVFIISHMCIPSLDLCSLPSMGFCVLN
jgi:hypothetical protein